jgi:hypothetical protein
MTTPALLAATIALAAQDQEPYRGVHYLLQADNRFAILVQRGDELDRELRGETEVDGIAYTIYPDRYTKVVFHADCTNRLVRETERITVYAEMNRTSNSLPDTEWQWPNPGSSLGLKWHYFCHISGGTQRNFLFGTFDDLLPIVRFVMGYQIYVD